MGDEARQELEEDYEEHLHEYEWYLEQLDKDPNVMVRVCTRACVCSRACVHASVHVCLRACLHVREGGHQGRKCNGM